MTNGEIFEAAFLIEAAGLLVIIAVLLVFHARVAEDGDVVAPGGRRHVHVPLGFVPRLL